MSDEKNVIILKLGGSVITEKKQPFSLRKEIIENTINQIIESNKRIILVHGGGSFGHPIAKEYKIHEGRNLIIKNQELGLAETHAAMEELNQFVIDAFLMKKKPALSIQPSTICLKEGNQIHLKGITQIEMSLKLGILPVLYGDIVYNTEQFFSILSGDEIIYLLCKNLRNYHVNRVIFATETDGVFIKDEKNRDNPILAEEIFDHEIPHLNLADFSEKIDVTGGIRGKLKAITKITRLGVPVQIINGLKQNFILKALRNEPLKSTQIKVSPQEADQILKTRKTEHLKIPIEYDVQHTRNFFDEIQLIHHALPEYDYEDINIKTELYGYNLQAPIVISALTGGTNTAKKLNQILARVAQQEGIIMSVGSQRIGVEEKSTVESFEIVRQEAKDIPIIGNIGIGQISDPKFTVDNFRECIEMIDADVMAIHFNALQEILQKHGDRSFENFEEKFTEIRENVSIPIFAKEIGTGFDVDTIKKLDHLGFDGFDVGGMGGTSFAALEGLRSKESSHVFTRNPGETFREWGIPTPACILYCRHLTKKPIIATGGLRNGIDIAKSLLLGANFGGFANNFLRSAWKDIKSNSFEKSRKEVRTLKKELKSTMWLLNIGDLADFPNQNKRFFVKRKLAEWTKLIKKY
ncbi:MAG: type 2 isopentenyl-diphosphate Delta-isomerase [Promethearchaeia archaeon]